MLTLVSQFATAIDAVGIGFDPSGEIFLYGGSDADITRLSASGVVLGTLPRPAESSTHFDLDRADAALSLNGIAVPAGSLLAFNGQSGAAEIYSLDPVTGAVLASRSTTFGNGFVVGGAYHEARGTFFLVQARQATSANRNLVAEINPQTGELIRSFKIDPTDFTMDFGDIEVDPFSGNLLLVSADEASVLRVTPQGRLIGQLDLPAGISGAVSGIAMNPAVEGEAFITTTTGNVYRIAGLDSFAPYVNLDTLGFDEGFGLIGIADQPIPDDGDPLTPLPPDTSPDGIGQAVGGGGDFNGDGIADVLATSTRDEETERQEIYIVFGKMGSRGDIDMEALAPADGLVLVGAPRFQAGFSLAFAGDVNGDGIDDIIIGAYGSGERPAFGELAQNGRAYVVFGRTSGFGTPDAAGRNVINLSSLTPNDGFLLSAAPNSQFGWSVSAAGDINGDGRDDLLVGAPQQRFRTNDVLSPPQTSNAYVIYGKDGPRDNVSVGDLAGADGFVIASNGTGDEVGTSVSAIGDFNADGFADIVIGAQSGDDGGNNAGEAYILFGKAGGGFGLIDGNGRDVIGLATLSTSRGFVIQGVASDELGNAVSGAGDVNGDGIDDLIVSAVRDDDVGGGSVYLIFGRNGGFGALDGNGRNVLDPTTLPAGQGVRIRIGINFDELGFDVSRAGDVNGDGFGDLLVSATGVATYGPDPGETYLIFGRANFAATFDPMRMSDGDGIVLHGGESRDLAGYSVAAAGDVNGDGYDDLIIGSTNDETGGDGAGQAYVVYGRADWSAGNAPPPIEGTGGDDNLDGTAGDDVINGLGGNDDLDGLAGNDVLNGGDGNDLLRGGGDDDVMNGGAGNDAGLIDDNGDLFDGGDGTDTAVVQGAPSTLTVNVGPGTEVVLVAPGNDTRFGDTAGNSYDYNLALTAAGTGTLTVIANDLRPGEDLVLNGSALTRDLRFFGGQGNDTATGGGGNDGFFFGADGNWGAGDRVDGGAGIDSLALRGPYAGANSLVFGNTSFANIEVLVLLTGLANPFGGPLPPGGYDYNVTLADGNVAAGLSLDIVGTSLGQFEVMIVNASAETDGRVRIFGGIEQDSLTGGGGADIYAYRSIEESTAQRRDGVLLDGSDRIDLSFIDAISGTAANDGFSFIGSAAFGNLAGQLRAVQSTATRWLVEADVDGDGIADLVIDAFTTGAAVQVTSDTFIL